MFSITASDCKALVDTFPSYHKMTRGAIEAELSKHHFGSNALKSQKAHVAAILPVTLLLSSLIIGGILSGIFIGLTSNAKTVAIGYKICIGFGTTAAASLLATAISFIVRYYLQQHKASKEELAALKEDIGKEIDRELWICEREIKRGAYYQKEANLLNTLLPKK